MIKHLESVIDLAKLAGEAVLEVYNQDDHRVELKEDDSPITKADKASNDIITKGLSKISELPIISEENETKTVDSDRFWLVDPLDGTKEFIKRNGEFTVNIALIDNQEPILGVVYAPAKNVLYAADDSGAFKESTRGKEPIKAVYKKPTPTVIVSRSHRDKMIEEFLGELGECKQISMGSSLKLCLIAEGRASHYPRFAPTYTWDTAAADAIVRAAGGSVKDLHGKPLVYPPKVQKNPFFISKGENPHQKKFRLLKSSSMQ